MEDQGLLLSASSRPSQASASEREVKTRIINPRFTAAVSQKAPSAMYFGWQTMAARMTLGMGIDRHLFPAVYGSASAVTGIHWDGGTRFRIISTIR
jgi:hypothetical protein